MSYRFQVGAHALAQQKNLLPQSACLNLIISQPLDGIELDISGKTGMDLWNLKVAGRVGGYHDVKSRFSSVKVAILSRPDFFGIFFV
jgi:hypothetical protein